jgi:hypothetical protein
VIKVARANRFVVEPDPTPGFLASLTTVHSPLSDRAMLRRRHSQSSSSSWIMRWLGSSFMLPSALWLLIGGSSLCSNRCSFSVAESLSLDAKSSSATATAAVGAAGAGAASSHWKHVEQGPPDAILGIAQAFRECVSFPTVYLVSWWLVWLMFVPTYPVRPRPPFYILVTLRILPHLACRMFHRFYITC